MDAGQIHFLHHPVRQDVEHRAKVKGEADPVLTVGKRTCDRVEVP